MYITLEVFNFYQFGSLIKFTNPLISQPTGDLAASVLSREKKVYSTFSGRQIFTRLRRLRQWQERSRALLLTEVFFMLAGKVFPFHTSWKLSPKFNRSFGFLSLTLSNALSSAFFFLDGFYQLELIPLFRLNKLFQHKQNKKLFLNFVGNLHTLWIALETQRHINRPTEQSFS